MSKEQFQPKVMEVTTLFDSDLAEYEYMQEQEAAKKAKDLADAIYTDCPACLLEEEAEMIAKFVIEEQGYCKQSEGEWIKDEDSKFEHRYYCSVCNFYLIGEPTKYCEDCGAHMKGGAE